MIITRAMPTQQTAIIGVSRRITAGQEFKAGLCRAPGGTKNVVYVSICKSRLSRGGCHPAVTRLSRERSQAVRLRSVRDPLPVVEGRHSGVRQ
jgi:hypothetical protein